MVQAHYMLGVVYRDLKQPDQAIQSLARAIAEDPSYAKASYLLGVMLHEGGRPAEAGRHFRRYLELQPDGPSAPRVRELLQSSTPFRR
jgi:tetratricopeptide (TPR) repeat protein